MSAGWVLVQTTAGAATDVSAALARQDGITLVEQTEGAYDVVARVGDVGEQGRSVKRVVQAALRLPGVTLAVCCRDNEGAAAPTLDLDEPRGTDDEAWVRAATREKAVR